MRSHPAAARRLLRALTREKSHVALLVDQHTRKEGIWVPFFGRPASTTPAPAVLALATGAPILSGYCRRLPGTYQFEMVIDEPIIARSTGDKKADVERITTDINERFETYIRRFPDQWVWLHRRWHTPPWERGKGTEG